MSATAIALIVVRAVLWIVLLIMSIILPCSMIQAVSLYLQESFLEGLVREDEEDEEDEEALKIKVYDRLIRCSGNAMAMFVTWTVALVLVLKI